MCPFILLQQANKFSREAMNQGLALEKHTIDQDHLINMKKAFPRSSSNNTGIELMTFNKRQKVANKNPELVVSK